MDVANVGICTETAGKNCGIYCGTPNIRFLYWGGEDAGAQTVRGVMGVGPQTRGMQQIQ